MENTNKDIFCFNNPSMPRFHRRIIFFPPIYQILPFFSIMKCLAHVILFVQRDRNMIKTKLRKNKMALDELLCELFYPQFEDYLFYFILFYKSGILFVLFLYLCKKILQEKSLILSVAYG